MRSISCALLALALAGNAISDFKPTPTDLLIAATRVSKAKNNSYVSHLFLFDVATKKMRPVTSGFNDVLPTRLGKDGSIAFVRILPKSKGNKLMLLKKSFEAPREILNLPKGSIGQIEASADGRTIAVSMEQVDWMDLYIYRDRKLVANVPSYANAVLGPSGNVLVRSDYESKVYDFTGKRMLVRPTQFDARSKKPVDFQFGICSTIFGEDGRAYDFSSKEFKDLQLARWSPFSKGRTEGDVSLETSEDLDMPSFPATVARLILRGWFDKSHIVTECRYLVEGYGFKPMTYLLNIQARVLTPLCRGEMVCQEQSGAWIGLQLRARSSQDDLPFGTGFLSRSRKGWTTEVLTHADLDVSSAIAVGSAFRHTDIPHRN